MMDFQNPFVGINPLYHEMLLIQNRWMSFHNAFLVECFKTLSTKLRGSGYKVELEDTLYIHPIGQDMIRYRPDLYISTKKTVSYPQQVQGTNAVVAVTDILDIDDEDENPLAIVIHRDEGEPIAWIELLSPTNKLPNHAYYQYAGKRKVVLSMGIVFVEIDFIHTQSPTFRYPDYSKHENNAKPFHITTIIPNPSLENGVAQVLHFGVMNRIPIIKIPLLGDETVEIDLDAIYQQLFVDADYLSRIDKSVATLTTYHPDDREKILAHLDKHDTKS
jgi:hypothetical protein